MTMDTSVAIELLMNSRRHVGYAAYCIVDRS